MISITGTPKISIDQVVETASSLPPLPQTTLQLISILADPMFEVRDVIKVAELDPALSADLLRLANSAARGSGNTVATVRDAVVRLGSGSILAVALARSCRPQHDLSLGPYGLTGEDYWQHCVAGVAAAEELAGQRLAEFGVGFNASILLHDFGKLILSSHVDQRRMEEMEHYIEKHPGCCPVVAERAVLGIDHAAAGAIVTRHWNLPDEVSSAIEHHHSPSEWSQNLWNGVIIANQIAHEITEDIRYTVEGSERLADAMLALGLDDITYHTIVDQSRQRFESLVAVFS